MFEDNQLDSMGHMRQRIYCLFSGYYCKIRLKITGIINNVFRPQRTLKKTRIKLYNTLALLVLLYGSKTWTIKARDT